MLGTILWLVLAILVIGWLVGFFFANVGGIIHILLVVAAIILIYNIFVGSSRNRTSV